MADSDKKALKRSNSDAVIANDKDGPPPLHRARSEDGSGDARPTAPPCSNVAAVKLHVSVELPSGRIYKFNCDAVGSFHIEGGNTGNFTVGGCKVIIKDDEGRTMFDLGGPNDKVEIKDDEKKNTTTVSLIPGVFTPNTTDREGRTTFNNLPGATIQSSNGTTIVTSSNGSISVSHGYQGHGFVQQQQNSTVNIVAQPHESIVLWASLKFAINGDGGYIKKSNFGLLVVNGSPQGINHEGDADVEVYGDVNGPIEQTDGGFGGRMRVLGKVAGSISQTGNGAIYVKNDVIGDVSQTGTGDISIHGCAQSNVSQIGAGSMYIHYDVGGNINQIGSGDINVQGVHRQGRVLKSGSGALYMNGTLY